MTSLEQDGIVLAEGQKMASLGGGGGHRTGGKNSE